MAQGLTISLISGADTAMKSDGGGSEAESQGAIFGEMFGEMFGDIVQPAKTSPGGAKLPHLPVGISMLSGVSQAVSAAGGSAEGEAAANTLSVDSALLAASLLGQIALKDKSPTGAPDMPAENTDELSAELVADVNVLTANVEEGGTDLTGDQVTDPAIKALLLQTDTVDSKSEGQPQSAGSTLYTATTYDAELKTVSSTNSSIQGDIANKTADSAVKGIKADIALASVSDPDNAGNVKAALQQEVAASPDNDEASKSGIETKLPAASTEAKNIVQANLSKDDTSELKGPEINAVQSAGVAQAAHTASATEKSKFAEGTTVSGDKLAQKVMADKAEVSPGIKSGSEQSSQQQNPQQQSGQQNSAALNDSLLAMSDTSLNTTAKVPADVTGAVRADTQFNSSLLAAQHQQSSVTKTNTQTMAEQLKQSLNLQQQDAAGQLRERVSLMVRQNIQVAEIRLDPAGLGQMQIKIDMQQDQASVQFVVQQPQAKELLEQQLPRLREMLQQQGIVLGEGNVQQQSQQQERQLAQRNNDGGNAKQQAGDDAPDGQATGSTVQINTSISERLVDYYA